MNAEPQIQSGSPQESPQEVQKAIETLLDTHHALTLATTGGEYSPWLLGAYYAYDKDLNIYVTLEKSGKSLRNVQASESVSLMISDNDAMKDFVQAQGRIVILPENENERVHAMLTRKMPWYQLYTPSVYARIEIKRYFISSFARGWFPAKQFAPATQRVV